MQAIPGLNIGMQVGSALSQGIMQSRDLKAEAATDQENARLDLLQGAFQAEDINRRGRATQAEAVSSLAEGGGDVGGLSARDLLLQNSLSIEYAAMNAKYGAASAARGDLYKAASAKQAAKAAIFGSFLKAGAAAISGISGQMQSTQLRNAYFPGGQQLPMPGSYAPPPSYAPTGVYGPRD